MQTLSETYEFQVFLSMIWPNFSILKVLQIKGVPENFLILLFLYNEKILVLPKTYLVKLHKMVEVASVDIMYKVTRQKIIQRLEVFNDIHSNFETKSRNFVGHPLIQIIRIIRSELFVYLILSNITYK